MDKNICADDWIVKDAPLKLARELVRQHHYAKGASKLAVYLHGLFNKNTGVMHGVAWWIPPTRAACESVNRENWKKVLSLSRMVMVPETPKNACSFLLSRSIKIIRAEGRFVSLVTYADESQGHTGNVYKASNFIYVGRTGPTPKWVDPVSGRQVSSKANVSRTKEKMESLGFKKVGSFYKHKYVMHLKCKTYKSSLTTANYRTLQQQGLQQELVLLTEGYCMGKS